MTTTIKTVNLELGMPSIPQARSRLTSEIRLAQQSGVQVLKVIHGYGSSGIGGDLRFALQSTLRQMAQAKEIRDCIWGENWRTSDERSWELLKRTPELKADSDLGRGNKGISLVVL
ncbi:MAG: Smr/MutS family protein [Candidatus Korobacteraceae bacterium]